MTKGYTYFCTDKAGNTYTRYSANHNAAQYTFASIYRREGTANPVDKSQINYSRQRGGAQAIANRFAGMSVNMLDELESAVDEIENGIDSLRSSIGEEG